jgi:hypothetical protein
VSLIAIFLALALGVVIGAGVIERGVVDLLNSRLDKVEAKSEQRARENDALRVENDRRADVITGLQDFDLGSRLGGESIALVAVRGVDESRVTKAMQAVQQAGAVVNGVLWIEGAWGDRSQATALGAAVNEPGRRGAALRNAAWRRLVGRLTHPPLTTTADSASTDLLAVLESQGFVGYDEGSRGLALTTFPGRGVMFLLVVGDDGDVASDDVVMPAATAFAAESSRLVIADLHTDRTGGPGRGDVFRDLLAGDLARTVTTVDDLDDPVGPTLVALALADLTCQVPVVGHYGYGNGTRALPDPASVCTGVAATVAAR